MTTPLTKVRIAEVAFSTDGDIADPPEFDDALAKREKQLIEDFDPDEAGDDFAAAIEAAVAEHEQSAEAGE